MSSRWNQETKMRLSEKVASNMNDVASLSRQIIRNSRSNELLEKAAKNFAYQETAVDNSLTTLKRLGLLASHLQFQAEAIERNVVQIDDIQDQLKTLRRRNCFPRT
ncbi:hypothetical protein CAPTEDRAFT_186337 [Capitella teleta]|uniref:BLOC-1-related complex subunit 7 n=1 Tax=Capitella teleta TaxID=283909 RepID=R7VL11_CAPTE|nr:hypothetical protein CAPTEDRAFT_186337 [Capitella teleta]|eukprot:ELU17871.1 hypothetical protein CAPTEDRAFT_186337 [Capitella teleta]